MKWTEDQFRAIATRNTNLLVSAAAGSGKTALLIERIRRMIMEEGVPVSGLLVLTFTRSAAAEMKDRLKRTLQEALLEPQAEHAAILEALSALPTASISTLHAFCQGILREYFQEAGIDPEFILGGEGELTIMRKEAMESLFEEKYQAIPPEETDAFAQLVEMYTGNRDDQGLKELVEKFYNFLMTLPNAQAWCEGALQNFDMNPQDFWESPWGKTMRQDMAVDLGAAQEILEECLVMVEDSEIFAKTQEQLAGDAQGVTRALEALEEGPEAYSVALKAITFPRYKGSREDKETSDAIKDQRNMAKEVVKAIQKKMAGGLEASLEALSQMKGPIEALVALTMDFWGAFRKRKEEKAMLDFNDLEQYTLKVLENPSIAAELQAKYQHVFLDEYQDTNGMQEAIIQCILRRDNYFMVGDVKQSIYRFRLADPGIFIEKYNRFKGSDTPEETLITLSQNFRSCQGVVDGVNGVFEKIMTPELGEVDYDDRARLYKGMPGDGPYTRTVVHILETGRDEEDASTNRSPVECEAAFIAREIQGMVGKPIYITKSGETRTLRYRDIGVLMRAVAATGDTYARIFSEAGIPVYFEGGRTYYESLEIILILNLLKIIDNGDQDIPLVSVMLSPMGGFTVEECTKIRLGAEMPWFHQSLRAYVQNQEDDLARKAGAFLEKLREWALDAQTLSVEDFLWKLYQDTGYYAFVGALPGGAQRQSNLRVLLKRAGDYKRSTLKGVFHFIAFIEQMKKHKFDTSPPVTLGENADVVRIMSIHKSKGLEFPVVFVAGMGRRFNTKSNSGRVLFHKDLGICPDKVDPESRLVEPTIAKALCGERVRVESLSEEMRLLYVAMTRAMESLILVGGVKDLKGSMVRWQRPASLFYLKKAQCFLDWVMLSAVDGGSVMPALPEDGGKAITPMGCYDITLHSQGSGESAVLGKATAPLTLENLGDIGLAEEVRRRLAWRYPSPGEREPPEKMTVTEIAKVRAGNLENGVEAPELVIRPAFLQQSAAGFAPAELGTGIHTILQGLDLQKIRDCGQDPDDLADTIEKQAANMAAQERIAPELLAALNLEPIQRFFTTETGRRLLAAKTLQRELPFNYQVEAARIRPEWAGQRQTITIQGMIDCCFLEDGAWVLLDYKTDRFFGAKEKERLVARYQTQLGLYAEALAALTGIPVKEQRLCFLMENV